MKIYELSEHAGSLAKAIEALIENWPTGVNERYGDFTN